MFHAPGRASRRAGLNHFEFRTLGFRDTLYPQSSARSADYLASVSKRDAPSVGRVQAAPLGHVPDDRPLRAQLARRVMPIYCIRANWGRILVLFGAGGRRRANVV